MLEENLRKYFAARLHDLESRKFRVWQKIENHILRQSLEAEANVDFNTHHFNLGLKPLALAFVLVLLGGISVNAYNSLPGDRFYTLRKAVEEAHLLLAKDDKSEQDLQISIIEKKVQEVAKIENRIANGENLTVQEARTVEAIKSEVGKAALHLLKVANVETKTAAPGSTVAKTATDKVAPATEPEIDDDDSNLVAAAEAKVGDAVIKFLQSTVLSGQEKQKQLLEVAKRARAEAVSQKETAGTPAPTTESQKESSPAPNGEEPETAKPQTDSKIQGEVIGEVKIVE